MMHLALAAGALADPQFQKNQSFDDHFWEKPEGRDVVASMEKVIEGIRAYQLHPYKRPDTARPVVFHDGEVRLFHYAAKGSAKARILVIPSMINGSEILDLLPGRSLMEWLCGEGFDVYLVDWGDLTKDEDLKSIDAAIGTKIGKILDWLKSQSALPLVGIGYCMGGLLLAAADILHTGKFDALCFIATPWDFEKDTTGNFSEAVIDWAKDGLPQVMHLDYMPAHRLQMIFAGVDPSLIAKKFSAFAGMKQDSEEAKLFVAVEDWVNGGSDLPSSTVQHTVGGWYLQNKPVRGEWTVAGAVVDAGKIAKPSLVIVPGRDKIVPPDSARPLARQMVDATVMEPACGHISMMIGRGAESDVWAPMRDWIISRCNIETAS